MCQPIVFGTDYPYNAIYLAFGLSSFAMRQIGAVIAPLHPRDQRQDLFKVIRPQRQNNLYDPPELRHRQRRSFFSPSAASGATERNRFPVALEKFWAVSQSGYFYTTGLSHLFILLTS